MRLIVINESDINRFLTDDHFGFRELAKIYRCSLTVIQSSIRLLNRDDVNQRISFKRANFTTLTRKNREGRELARRMIIDGHKVEVIKLTCNVSTTTIAKIRREINKAP